MPAGNDPTGLAVADVNGDGKLRPDASATSTATCTGGSFSNGDGTFQPYLRTEQGIGLAVAGPQDLFLTSEAEDTLAMQAGTSASPTIVQDRNNGILAPGKPVVVTTDGFQYLVVPNSGANQVRIYPLIDGQPDANQVQSIFTGTDPVGITIAYLNGASPDVIVANAGSNDVSIFLGSGQGADWTLMPGPRLQVGQGPVATAVTTLDGQEQLAVLDSQSDDVRLLPSRGNGFFSDQPADVRTIPVGSDPQALFIGNFGGPGTDLVTLNLGSNNLSFISDLGGASVESTID